MSKVVISGYYGFGNAGDEAMLVAIIEALAEIDPNIHITVISGNPEETKKRHGVEAVFRLNYPSITKALLQSDLLISGGGSLLQDVTSDRSLYYYLSIVLLAKRLGKPVMLYAQGIGPVRGSVARGAMKRICNTVDLITVRDEGSKFELQSMQINKPPVFVTADPVLGMNQVDKQIGRRILRDHGHEGTAPIIGISVREWKEWSHYKQVLAEAADFAVKSYGARIIFLPMQCPDDVAAAQKIAQRMDQPALVLTDTYSTVELMSLVGNCNMLVGIRLHALVFAAVMNVPMVGLSYDPKIDRFMETLGEFQAGSLLDITTDKLIAKINEIFTAKNKTNPKVNKQLAILREKAFSNAVAALDLIKVTERS